MLMILSIIVPFLLTTLYFNFDGTTPNKPISIKDVAPFLRFISAGKVKSILIIAVHNFILTTVAYILSILTCGISGVPSLITSNFVFAITIKAAPNTCTILFVLLEFVGIILANFYGAYLGINRRNEYMSIKNISIKSFIMLPVIFIIYLAGAFIESGLIYGLY